MVTEFPEQDSQPPAVSIAIVCCLAVVFLFRELASVNTDAPAGQWHTIRVTHKGNHIRCYLNGKLHLDVKDATFSEFGPVGLWTKADAVTSFDDFAYRDF